VTFSRVSPGILTFSLIVTSPEKLPIMPQKQKSPGRTGMMPRRGRKQRKASISLNPIFMPINQRHTLAFADRRQLTEPTVGAGVNYTYTLNGMFDPNITGAGAQPVGFDPISAMFQRYRVVGVRFQITVVNRSQNSLTCGYCLSDTNALASTILAWFVDPKSTSFTMGGQSGGNNMRIIDRTLKPWDALTVPKAQYMTARDYSGSAIANPPINLYLIVWATGTTAIADVDLVVKISYLTEFQSVILQASS
jgi:hypothetical protein